MTDKQPGPDLAPKEATVLASLTALGAATAAKIGEDAGLAYSTTTPKLRKLEDLGLAARYRDTTTNQTLWRPTTTEPDAGTATPTTTGDESADDPATPDDTPPDRKAAAEMPADDDAVPQTADVPDHEKPVQTADEADDGTDDSAAHTDPGNADRAADHVDTVTDRSEPASPDQATDPHDGAGPDTSAQPGAAQPAETDVAVPGIDHTAAGEPDAAPAAPDEQAGGEPTTVVPKRKREPGELEATVLAILQAHPDQRYRTNDLRKLIDQTDAGKGLPRASAGAVSNAAVKLAGKHLVVAGEAKPATFQAAPATS